MDRLLAALGLLTLWPVMIAVSVAIRIDSNGPALLFQQRVGRNKAIFRCIKFRTMTIDTPDIASHLASTTQITSVGMFLRVSKLDEIPQLWNVLIGQMNLVGYRPCLPNQQDVIDARESLGVFDEKPGITGLAQISKVDMSTPQELAKLDAQYISTSSLTSYFKILLQTVTGAGNGDAANRIK